MLYYETSTKQLDHGINLEVEFLRWETGPVYEWKITSEYGDVVGEVRLGASWGDRDMALERIHLLLVNATDAWLKIYAHKGHNLTVSEKYAFRVIGEEKAAEAYPFNAALYRNF